MHLITNWQRIAKKAWSFRLGVLAGVLTACEIILPLFFADLPRNLFAVLSLFVVTGAMVARLVAQKEFGHDKE